MPQVSAKLPGGYLPPSRASRKGWLPNNDVVRRVRKTVGGNYRQRRTGASPDRERIGPSVLWSGSTVMISRRTFLRATGIPIAGMLGVTRLPKRSDGSCPERPNPLGLPTGRNGPCCYFSDTGELEGLCPRARFCAQADLGLRYKAWYRRQTSEVQGSYPEPGYGIS